MSDMLGILVTRGDWNIDGTSTDSTDKNFSCSNGDTNDATNPAAPYQLVLGF